MEGMGGEEETQTASSAEHCAPQLWQPLVARRSAAECKSVHFGGFWSGAGRR